MEGRFAEYCGIEWSVVVLNGGVQCVLEWCGVLCYAVLCSCVLCCGLLSCFVMQYYVKVWGSMTCFSVLGHGAWLGVMWHGVACWGMT